MRIVIALLLVAVVLQSALAVTSKANQAKLMIEKINNNLEKSHLGRALKNMITLATKLGYEYSNLYDAFEALQSSLLKRKQDENQLFENQTATHNDNVQTHESSVNHYNSEIKEGDAQLLNEQQTLQEQEDNLKNAHEYHDAVVVELDESRQFLANLEASYEYEVSEFQQAKDLIQQAVDTLRHAQEHFESGELGNVAFVELKTNFASFAQKLTITTSKLSAKHQLFVKPVVQAMAQVKSASNQSSIENAINALEGLQAYFGQALQDATTIYVETKEYLVNQIANSEETIALYENHVIPAFEGQVAASKVSIQQTEEWLAQSHAALVEAEQALVDENEAFARTTERHNALVARLDAEYDLVAQAERIIRNAQSSLEA